MRPAHSTPSRLASLLPLVCGALLGCSSAPPGDDAASADEDLTGTPARFDVVTIDDTTDAACPWNRLDADGQPRCISMAEWRPLNYARPHFVVMGSDDHRAEIEAAGNRLALYFNTLNDGWSHGQSGAAAAADAWQWALDHFAGAPPTWFVVNEVSRGGWEGEPGDADGARYRTYVEEFVAHLAGDHQRQVILCTPYVAPPAASAGAKAAAQAAAWRAIAKHAFVAAEVQMTGAAVASDPTLPTRAIGRTIDAYAALGIDTHARLMIVDNFANTRPGAEYGRAGASIAQWETAIAHRAQAYQAHGAQLRGYLSYGWAGNAMGSTSATRVGFEHAYAAQKLP